ncbi:MAG: dUTP diphosphatase [bacterium]
MSSKSNVIKAQIFIEPGAADIPLPSYQTPHASGMDLHANVEQEIILQPGVVTPVSAGIRIALPEGYEAQIRPRSGLALKHSIGLLNSPGTIDADYRGPVVLLLFNFGKQPHTIRRGDRIAQMIIQKVERVEWEVTTELEHTRRGEGGFGHTGR